MAFVSVADLPLPSFPRISSGGTLMTVNAAGESGAIIGKVRFVGSGSKVISSAGGSIFWFPITSVMADAGSTLRIGLQDVVQTTGLQDLTFDVNGDYVGGGTVPTGGIINEIAMSTGTKTLSNGDEIAIVANLVSRGGADAVAFQASTIQNVGLASAILGLPYGTINTGALAKSNALQLWAAIKFDDGTIGWIQGTGVLMPLSFTSVTFNSGSTPDEYIGTFLCTWAMKIHGIGAILSGIAAGETFEVILYSDPYGTPTVVATATPDPDVLGGAAASAAYHIFPIAEQELIPGTTYGVAIRPTTAGSLIYFYSDLGTGMDELKTTSPYNSVKMAARTNQTGAFVETQVYHAPTFILDISQLSDNIGAGGGGQHASAF